MGRAFDVVAADMDVDGDVDVLVNWHHLVRMELFENVAGRFELVNPLERDETGLFDNPGKRGRMGKAALRTVQEEFNIRRMVDGIEEAVRYCAEAGN